MVSVCNVYVKAEVALSGRKFKESAERKRACGMKP